MPPAHLRAPPLPVDAPRRMPPAIGCSGKVAHANQHVAGISAKRIKGKVYRCRHCGLWHISREEIRDKQAAEKAGMHVR